MGAKPPSLGPGVVVHATARTPTVTLLTLLQPHLAILASLMAVAAMLLGTPLGQVGWIGGPTACGVALNSCSAAVRLWLWQRPSRAASRR